MTDWPSVAMCQGSSQGSCAGNTKTACGCVKATVRLIHLHCDNTQAQHCLGNHDSFSILKQAERPQSKTSNFNVILFTKLHFQLKTALSSFLCYINVSLQKLFFTYYLCCSRTCVSEKRRHLKNGCIFENQVWNLNLEKSFTKRWSS